MTRRCLKCGEPHDEEIALCGYCQYAEDEPQAPESPELLELRAKLRAGLWEFHETRGDPFLRKDAA